MSRRLEPKSKFERRIGESLWSSSNRRVETAPGQHGLKPRRNISDYGARLLAKQKLKFYYCNITENKLLNTYKRALKFKGNVGFNLVRLLELRLDVLVCRAKLAPTFGASRQMINHGHVLVNNSKVNICSYECRPNDVFRINPKFINAVIIKNSVLNTNSQIPSYIQSDYKHLTFRLLRIPCNHDIKWSASMCPALVAEHYSKVR
ncbi:MAG: 30S ribosomal protein S4 [Candidatus Hodgkinia cicadicola]